MLLFFFFFKQKTAYEMRISDWSSDVCSSDLLCGGGDRLHNAFGHRILDDDFELHLGQEVDDIFGAAIEFGVTLLPPETLGLGDGDPADTDFVQRFLHFVELERLDDRLNLLHASRPPLGWPPPFARQAGSGPPGPVCRRAGAVSRSEARRVGKAGVSKCRSRWCPD